MEYLKKMVVKEAMFQLSKEAMKAFTSLKEKFQQALVLAHFNPNMPICHGSGPVAHLA